LTQLASVRSCVEDNARAGNLGCPLCRVLWARPPAPAVMPPASTPRRRGGTRDEAPVPVPVPPRFADDDPVAPPPPPSAAAADGAPSVLSLSLQASCARVAASSAAAPVSALLTVRAPTAALPSVDAPGARGGVDLVAVLDVSGSMRGEKIALLRQTLLTAIEVLTDADRLCIVSFESHATRHTHLARMTPAGKSAARAAVVALHATGGTDISGALHTAVAVMAQRHARNAVAGVLLLTDGEDSYGHGLRDMEASVRACVAAGASLSCFGYGAGHDARLMEGLSESGRGRFTFIERAACVRDAFGAALGGFFSTAAQRVSLALRPLGGAALGDVHAPGGRVTSPDVTTLDLEDMFEGETRDVLVELTLPAADGAADVAIAYLEASLSWLQPGGAAAERVAAPSVTLAVARPAELAPLTAEEEAAGAATARALDLQRNRILAADATATAVATADGGGFEAAAAALRAAAASIVASPTGADAFCAALAADLADTAARVGSRGAYASGGSAKARVSSKSHRTQRFNEADFASPSARLYCSPAMLTTTALMRSTAQGAAGGAPAAAGEGAADLLAMFQEAAGDA
jgi:hypothetical protein